MKENSSLPFQITGIGGVFLGVNNSKEVRQWYHEKLGFIVDQYGAIFESKAYHNPSDCVTLQWSVVDKPSFFAPSSNPFTINYRVSDLEALWRHLQGKVKILDTIEVYSYGKFLHIMDVDNNKIELWEPIDHVFEAMYAGKMNRQISIGGIFFKSPDPSRLKTWYQQHLGMHLDTHGIHFKTRKAADSDYVNLLQWSVFDHNSTYFDPSDAPFMINYNVPDLDQLIETLRACDVLFLDDKIQTEYGDFIHIMGPENHKIELWQQAQLKESINYK